MASSTSSSLTNFYEKSKIPCTTSATKEMSGQCLTNVNGQCLSGGTLVSSSGGCGLASLGFPSTDCVTFPLFAASNQAYSITGWKVLNNANPLRLARPIL